MDVEARLADRERLYNDSSPWRSVMMRLTEVIRPVREEIRGPLVDGARRARNLYDATGIVANNNLGSAVYGSASNPADKWFALGTEDPDFNKWPRAKSALATLSRRVLASYGPSWTPFYAQTFPLYLDITGLGMGFFHQEYRRDEEGAIDGWTDKCIPLSEGEFRIDDNGRVTHFYRRFMLTKVELQKLAKEMGGAISDRANSKKDQDQIEVQHSVFPNDKYQRGMLGAPGMRFAGTYDEVEAKHEISRKGLRKMRYYAPAWERASGERHGRGAGEMAMADIGSLQVMQRSNLVGGEWSANPAWGYAHDANLTLSRLKPGALMAGAFDMRGNQVLKRLMENSGNPPFSLEMTNQLRQAIKDAFEGAIISIVAPNRTGMTPTEVLDVREERFRRMAPYHGNITSGVLDLHVRDRLDMMMEQGLFNDLNLPKILDGRQLHPKFMSPMAMAQAAAKASSAVRAATAIGQAAVFDPSVADRFNGDAYTTVINDGFGVPELSFDDDVTEQRREGRQQAAQKAQMAEVAEKAASAAKGGAQAVQALRQPAA